jgi:hypothetical protein
LQNEPVRLNVRHCGSPFSVARIVHTEAVALLQV